MREYKKINIINVDKITCSFQENSMVKGLSMTIIKKYNILSYN